MISRSFRSLAFVLISGALGCTLAACGSSSPPPSTSTTTTPPATTAPASIGPPTCSTGILEASAAFGGAAAGSSYYTVSVKNTGPAKCALDGYPKYAFLGPSGAGGAGAGSAVAISVVDRGPAASQVVIAPGSMADSLIVYSEIAGGGSNCPAIASALLTPPGSGESVSFPISFSPCGGSVQVYAFGKSGSESP